MQKTTPRPLLGIVGGLIALAAVSAHTAADAAPGKWAKARVLVQPRAGTSEVELDAVLKPHGGRVAKRLNAINVHVVELPATANEVAIAQVLAHNPKLQFAELDVLDSPEGSSNDPYYASAWHVTKIGANVAWDTALANNVVVAILDSGVDPTHSDLSSMLVSGWNTVDNNSNSADVYGHGTKVAGAAAAATNNALGVPGVAWGAKIMPIRVSQSDGYAYFSDIAEGITWAADHGAKVANVSFQTVSGSATIQSAAQYMKNKGGVVVVAAGNTSGLQSFAASNTMLSIAATDSNDVRASWSSYGDYVDLAAPGTGIWTTVKGGGYGAVSGTSFSSPITAGVVALMMAAKPGISPAAIESILKSTAVDLGTSGFDQYYGVGRINAAAAVQAAKGMATTDTTAPTTSITSPGAGATLKGVVAINASASDNNAVSKVELYVGANLIATDNLAPYAFSWDSTTRSDGAAVLTTKAYDAAGNIGTSAAVNVTVANSADLIAPTVLISNPSHGSSIGSSVKITANASDNVAVNQLSIYIDGQLKASVNAASTTYTWNARKASAGAHTIQAVASDAAGNKTTSSVTVYK